MSKTIQKAEDVQIARSIIDDTSKYPQDIDGIFEQVNGNISKRNLLITDLYKEYMQFWKKLVQTNTDMQQKFSKDIGLHVEIPEFYQKVLEKRSKR